MKGKQSKQKRRKRKTKKRIKCQGNVKIKKILGTIHYRLKEIYVLRAADETIQHKQPHEKGHRRKHGDNLSP